MMMNEKLNAKERRQFDYIIEHAVAGLRCPVKVQFIHRGHSPYLNKLAEKGFIIIEIWSKNYRVVEICRGVHKGARTAEAPTGDKPYKVINQSGTSMNGKAFFKQQSSTIRTLSESDRPRYTFTKQDELDAQLFGNSLK